MHIHTALREKKADHQLRMFNYPYANSGAGNSGYLSQYGNGVVYRGHVDQYGNGAVYRGNPDQYGAGLGDVLHKAIVRPLLKRTATSTLKHTLGKATHAAAKGITSKVGRTVMKSLASGASEAVVGGLVNAALGASQQQANVPEVKVAATTEQEEAVQAGSGRSKRGVKSTLGKQDNKRRSRHHAHFNF